MALWRLHGNAFFTGALYYDSQSVIRNLIITILCIQHSNPDAEFHIILEGTDHLETLFGNCHTQDHNWDFDVLQLSEKLGVSALIGGIFECNPDLNWGHR